MIAKILNKNTWFAALFLYTAVFHGAYFLGPLIVLNIFFLASLFLHRADIKIDITALLMLLLLAVMVFSWLLFSLSPHEGLVEVVKYALFPLAYIYFTSIHTNKSDDIFYKVFILIMVFGLLGVLGISPLPGMTAPLTGRLQSFVGYPNTAALVMGIGAFYATEKFKQTKSKPQLILLAAFAAGLILTLSRVTFVTFAVIYLLYIFPAVSLKIKLAATSGLAAIWGILALFDSRIINISLFAPTLVERYISYFDALGIMLLHPLGLGVSNWQFMQFYYQSAPYSVRFIHNFYLQIGLDGGFLALGIVLALLALALLKGKRNVHFYIILFILSGAFFEVHFNFGLIIVYFAYALASIKPPEGGFGIAIAGQKMKIARYAFLLPILPLAVLFTAHAFYNTGARHEISGNSREAYMAYANSLRLNRLNAGALHFAMGRNSPDFETAIHHLESAHNLNPWDTSVIFSLAQGHLHSGGLDDAYFFGNMLLDKFPLSTRNQELLHSIARARPAPYSAQSLAALEMRISDINAGINSLYRHIDYYFRY